jgi:putative FmdB family regulatory protein
LSTYDLICTKCNHSYEVYRQGFPRDKDKACPECGSAETRQTFASFLRNWGSGTSSSNCGPRIGGFG